MLVGICNGSLLDSTTLQIVTEGLHNERKASHTDRYVGNYKQKDSRDCIHSLYVKYVYLCVRFHSFK